jgi:uncharacterized membrane protein
VWTIGFVTGKVSSQLQSHLHQKTLSVFIPTTPNPTSGWYAIVPEEDAIDVTISIEDAFKVLISGGIVSPEQPTTDVPIALPKPYQNLSLNTPLAEKKSAVIPIEEES